jgi:hypothetical protein
MMILDGASSHKAKALPVPDISACRCRRMRPVSIRGNMWDDCAKEFQPCVR